MMTRILARLLASGIACVLVSTSSPAWSQSDLQQMTPPNVLLLVDSSGSMEWKSGSDQYPQCAQGGTERSRWIELLQVLTGTIQNYGCAEVDRTGQSFLNEYSYPSSYPSVPASGAVAPRDYGYRTPYHRPLSGDCTPAPGSTWSSGNPYGFPANSVLFRHLQGGGSCDFVQQQDGLLDTYSTQARFGLMTFDTQTEAGTGTANYQDGVTGTWSYFFGNAHRGRPTGCSADTDFEVGARNAAAPPWEGRLVSFGQPDLSSTDLATKSQQIQQILLATRPYGGTPIAGMLDDARQFLLYDTSKDPLDTSHDFGPYADPYVTGHCRINAIILLTDGEPNLDLRDSCSTNCPYDLPESIVQDLATAHSIKTFVIGFSLAQATLSNGSAKDCGAVDPRVDCANTADNVPLRACCNLNSIAYSGGTGHAYFASSMDQLRSAMSAVMASIVTGTTSRTLPVFSSSYGNSGSYRFYTSFLPVPLQLWQGVIERQRFDCAESGKGGYAISRTAGDDFVYRVNKSDPHQRFIYSAVSTDSSFQPRWSVRPLSADPDCAGKNPATLYPQYGKLAQTDNFVSSTPPASMGLTTSSSSCTGIGTPDTCRDRYLKWLLGLNTGCPNRCPGRVMGPATTPDQGSARDQSCKNATADPPCNLVADVYHSTPAVVGPPVENLADESYQSYSRRYANRPLVLYTSTNDGLLHAFKVGPVVGEVEKTDSNNELWAFIPPAVLPQIPSQYPATHEVLLDGAPVTRDIPVTVAPDSTVTFGSRPSPLTGSTLAWKTVLVQGFGSASGGYFALDVTQPDPTTPGDDPTTATTDSATSTKPGGPNFLWQLTTNASGTPLFGLGSGTPLITHLYYDSHYALTSGSEVSEVAVAVLPGGYGGLPIAPADKPNGCAVAADAPPLLGRDADYGNPRAYVNCYPDGGRGARSLTLVRLDTGEIIRSFRNPSDPSVGIASDRVIPAMLSSPIVGRPAAYPGGTGTIATQLYVGDADGVLWLVDVSSADPSHWTMKRFFDAYGGQSYNAGQPIVTAPMISTDTAGHVTVAFSTGDQDVFTYNAAMKNYLWSLTELTDTTSSYRPSVNWYQEFDHGIRVTGPLYLYNGALYFSTYEPKSASITSACTSDDSAIWGMDYIRPSPNCSGSGSALSTVKNQGGCPMLTGSDGVSLTQKIDNTDSRVGAGATIFGVTIAQRPTCQSESNIGDPIVNALHTQVTDLNSGQYQLVMQSGHAGAPQGGLTRTLTIDLPVPRSPPRIDAWGALVDWP